MNYPQAPGPVDRTVQATLASVEQRQGGWYRFAFQEDGQQYPLRADTKKVDLIQQAMSMMGQPVVAQIREQESQSINPNSGRPYINRHLNAIAPAGYAPGVQPNQGAPTQQQWAQQQGQQQQMPVQPGGQQQQWTPPQQQQPVQTPQQSQTWQQPVQQPQAQPQAAYETDAEKAVRIMRQAASKVVASMIDVLPPEQQTMQGLIGACEAWMAYYVHGPLRFGVQAFSTGVDARHVDGAQPGSPDEVYAATGVCPDCGHSGGQHAVGCPRGDFAQA